MNLRSSPVPGLLHGLRTFLLWYCVGLFIADFLTPGYCAAYALPLLLAGVPFALAYAADETLKSNALTVLIGFLCSAVVVLMTPGMALGVPATVRRPGLAFIFIAAILFIASVYHRLKMSEADSAHMPAIVLALVPVILYVISWDSLGDSAAGASLPAALYYSALAFVVLCMACSFADASADRFESMRGKATQPLGLFKRRLLASNFTIIAVLTGILLVLPSVHFSNAPLIAFLRYSISALLFLIRLTNCGPEDQFVDLGDDGSSDQLQTWGEGDGALWANIMVALIFVLVTAVIAYGAFRIVKGIVVSVRGFLSENKEKSERVISVSKYDTVEKVELKEEKKARRKLTEEESNAVKVRAIYRRRVAAVMKKDSGGLFSKAPDEITEMALEKGYDISGLTEIYKKARYTDSCTADDVSRARSSRAERVRQDEN